MLLLILHTENGCSTKDKKMEIPATCCQVSRSSWHFLAVAVKQLSGRYHLRLVILPPRLSSIAPAHYFRELGRRKLVQLLNGGGCGRGQVSRLRVSDGLLVGGLRKNSQEALRGLQRCQFEASPMMMMTMRSYQLQAIVATEVVVTKLN